MRQVTELQEPLQGAIVNFIRILEEHYGPFQPVQRRAVVGMLMTIAEAGMKQERDRMREFAKNENCEAMFMTGCPLFRHPDQVTGTIVVKETP